MLPALTGSGTTTGKKIRLIFHCLYAGWCPVVSPEKGGGLRKSGLVSNIWDNCLVLQKGDWALKFLKSNIFLVKKIKDKRGRNLYTAIASFDYKVRFRYDPRDPLRLIGLGVEKWTFDLRHPELGLQSPKK